MDGYIRNASSATTQPEAIGKPTDADVPSLEEEGNAALDAGVEHVLPVGPPDPVTQPLQRGDAAPEALYLGRQCAHRGDRAP
jgi:hypothetical protein